MIFSLIGYIIFALIIIGVYIWGTSRSYRQGRNEGWDACVEELVIDANAAEGAVTMQDEMVRSYVLPILQRRADTRELPLHTLETEHLLRLLDNSDRLAKP